MGAAGGLLNAIDVSVNVQANAGDASALPIVEVPLQGIHIGFDRNTLPYKDGNGFLVGTAASGQEKGGRQKYCKVMLHLLLYSVYTEVQS
jgi:hypothetical protein